MTRKFIGIFQLPGAQTTDQLCRSELHQAGFSCDFCYPLVPTVLNAAQIANKIATLLKTEFFNRIGQLPPVVNWLIVACGRLLPTAYQSFSWRGANRSILNGCSHQQRSFKLLNKTFREGQETAAIRRTYKSRQTYNPPHPPSW